MTHSWLALAAGTLLLHAPLLQEPQRPSEKLDLAGHWVMNAAMSDALPLLPGEALSVARAAGVVRTGSSPSRPGNGPDPRLITSVRHVLRKALHAATSLKIAQRGRTLTLVDADNRTLSLVADGREQEVEQGGLWMTVAASWQAPLFTVRREFADGTVVTDSYSTFVEPRQLVAISTISNRHMAEKPVIINRVYDPLER
jgi:hypothetical protein